MTIYYCEVEDCEGHGTHVIPDTATLLCDVHAEVYRWGQNDIMDNCIPENRRLTLTDLWLEEGNTPSGRWIVAEG